MFTRPRFTFEEGSALRSILAADPEGSEPLIRLVDDGEWIVNRLTCDEVDYARSKVWAEIKKEADHPERIRLLRDIDWKLDAEERWAYHMDEARAGCL